jgi:hypothetical protein
MDAISKSVQSPCWNTNKGRTGPRSAPPATQGSPATHPESQNEHAGSAMASEAWPARFHLPRLPAQSLLSVADGPNLSFQAQPRSPFRVFDRHDEFSADGSERAWRGIRPIRISVACAVDSKGLEPALPTEAFVVVRESGVDMSAAIDVSCVPNEVVPAEVHPFYRSDRAVPPSFEAGREFGPSSDGFETRHAR